MKNRIGYIPFPAWLAFGFILAMYGYLIYTVIWPSKRVVCVDQCTNKCQQTCKTQNP